MAATKKDLFKQAQTAGVVPDTVSEDDYTADELERLISGVQTIQHGKVTGPIVGPDGHQVLSKEDLDARNS